MRIQPGLLIELKKLLSDSQTTSDKGAVAALKSGEKVTAVILSVLDEWVSLDIKGQVVHAKHVGSEVLVENETVTLEVVETDGKRVEVKVLGQQQQPDGKAELEFLLKEQLSKLGAATTPRNMIILKAMHEQNVVIEKQSFQTLQQNLYYLQQGAEKLGEQGVKPNVDWQLAPKEFLEVLSKAASEVMTSSVKVSDGQTSQLKAEGLVQAVESDKTQVTSVVKGADAATAPIKQETQVTMPSQQPLDASKVPLDVQSRQNSQSDQVDIQIRNMISSESGAGQPVKSSEHMVLKHFKENLTEALKTTVNSTEKAAQTIAFMTKHDVPMTVLNTVVVNRFLTGKLGVFSGIENVFEGSKEALPEELNERLAKLIQKPLNWNDLPDKLDGKLLKELLEEVDTLQKSLQQSVIKSQTGEKNEQLELIKQTQNLLSESSMNWHALYLPVQVQRQLEDVEVYIKGDSKKKGALNPDDGLIYIALHTKNMSLVRVKIHLQPDFIKLDFIAEDAEALLFMKDYVNELAKRLGPLTKKEILIDFSAKFDEPNLAELEKVDVIGASSFDVRI
ncbi:MULTISPECIES: hypothetical protein [unclassified Fusibacter]|uniref:hypothetical protein n=1 Tax=unclassified Fusibacter TaxID=2624464 RepID=UPI0010122599|nr:MULTISPECIES: hypothetical protein [unclassified Fusibacter]MCK8059070.1 hypothetical protein [Fusibacter sp. A2]NPE22479.1 hypothetical protein [Fusibacter sp. A1]RXV60583.1 hypothetical protein DWB64_11580 [Fusibacter sp. A1]